MTLYEFRQRLAGLRQERDRIRALAEDAPTITAAELRVAVERMGWEINDLERFADQFERAGGTDAQLELGVSS